MKQQTKAESNPVGFNNFDALPDAANVSVDVVARLVDVTKPTAWRWARDGRLPKPLTLSPGCTRWNVGALRRHMAGLAA
jgi:prophage regulatory protein